MPESSAYKKQMDLLASIVHEMAHAISGNISKEKLSSSIDLQNLMEEAMADMMSNMYANYYINKSLGKPKNNINLFESATLYKQSGEKDVLNAMLIPLEKQGRDIEGIKAYFFENNHKFFEICEEVMGEEFSEFVEDLEFFEKGNQKVYNLLPEQNQARFRNKCITGMKKILENQGFLENVNVLGKDDTDSLYAKDSSCCHQKYCEDTIALNFAIKDLNKYSLEDLQFVTSMIGEESLPIYEKYGATSMSDAISNNFFEDFKDDEDAVDKIATLTNMFGRAQVPAKVVLKVLQNNREKKGTVNVDDCVEILKKFYANEQDEIDMKINEVVIDECIDNYADLDSEEDENFVYQLIKVEENVDYDNLYMTQDIEYFLRNSGLHTNEKKDVIKYFYGLDREERLKKITEALENARISTIPINSFSNDKMKEGYMSLMKIMQEEVRRANVDWDIFYEQPEKMELDEEGKAKVNLKNIINKEIEIKNDVINVLEKGFSRILKRLGCNKEEVNQKITYLEHNFFNYIYHPSRYLNATDNIILQRLIEDINKLGLIQFGRNEQGKENIIDNNEQEVTLNRNDDDDDAR